MLCYKDMTFCSSDCVNKSCLRYFSDFHKENSRKWWSHDPDNVPVAFSDFSGYCDDYEQKGDKEIREIADKLEARFKETMKILKDID